MVTLPQSMVLSCTSVCNVANWLLPVASMMLAVPFSRMASRIRAAAFSPAALPVCAAVSKMCSCIKMVFAVILHTCCTKPRKLQCATQLPMPRAPQPVSKKNSSVLHRLGIQYLYRFPVLLLQHDGFAFGHFFEQCFVEMADREHA